MNKKEIFEKIEDCKAEMQSIVDLAGSENRVPTDEENEKFNTAEKQVKDYENLLHQMEVVDNMPMTKTTLTEDKPQDQKDREVLDSFVRSAVEKTPMAAGSNITFGDNGAVIPTTIANEIIQKAREISPLFNDASKYNVKGNLEIPYVDESANNIAMDFASEFGASNPTSAKLKSITLSGHLAKAESVISKQLINNAGVDITNWVVSEMSRAVAEFFEACALGVKAPTVTGITDATTKVTTASATAITTDELIALQDSLASVYQNGAYWVMNPATLTALRKLKDGEGRYILNPDLREGFGYQILGKPVYTSDQMPVITASKNAIVYINPAEALAAQVVENFELQVLTETYYNQHAVGLCGWTEMDCKVKNQQAVSVLTMKAGA